MSEGATTLLSTAAGSLATVAALSIGFWVRRALARRGCKESRP